MAAGILSMNSALLPRALSQELSLLWESLCLGQKESSGPRFRALTVSSISINKTGPTLLQGVEGPALTSKIRFRAPSLRPAEKLMSGFPNIRVPKTLFPERLVGTPTGVLCGLDEEPLLAGVAGIAGGHDGLFVLGRQAGTRS